ncbi:Solanesyl diphosphate synthase [Melia azedarach]|uniref:Solanesyl diphosphate synthase n=1 Tax=Melia azedarach TaxID=155640 RepID=A0ACC1WVC1_MELAZ|nr:Solanesyl diphosphate synthase [Melia azedarach]
MFFSQGFSRIAAVGFFLDDLQTIAEQYSRRMFWISKHSWSSPNVYCSVRHGRKQPSSSLYEEQLDPFSLVVDELSLIAKRLQSMVVAEVLKFASAAGYTSLKRVWKERAYVPRFYC